MAPRPSGLSLLHRLLSQGAWAAAGKGASVLVALVLNFLLARLLNPAEIGIYFLGLSLATFLALAGQFGLGDAVVREVAKASATEQPQRAAAYTAQSLIFVCVFSGSSALLLASPLGRDGVAALFGQQMLGPVLPFVAVWGVLLALQELLVSTFRGYQNIKLATVFGGLLASLIVCVFLAASFLADRALNLRGALWAILLALTLSISLGLWRLKGKVTLSRIRRVPLRELLGHGWHLWLNGLATFFIAQMAIWLAAAFLAPDQVALFGAAARLMQLLILPLVVAEMFLPSVIVELHSPSRIEQLQGALRGAATLSVLPTFAGVVLFAIAGDAVLRLLYGSFYGQAAGILIILSFGQLASAACGSCGYALSMTGHARLLLLLTTGTGLLTCAASIVSVQRFGMIGLAVTTASGVAIVNVLAVLAARKKVGIWVHAHFDPRAIGRLWNAGRRLSGEPVAKTVLSRRRGGTSGSQIDER